ncbi:hypothetical protein SDC9_206370 [bioreactor metagenome]|uniref:YetF C-terminal domain-containing protein n=1 Tax=bioreactor metagenome TaxID=1076179 RepID=A0A645J7I8_9ZZZZ
MEQLRSKDVSNIAEVEYAILETNGELSILKKELKKDVINEDMQIYRPYEGLPLALILDGRINESNVKAFGFDLLWLQDQLRSYNIDSAKDVLLFNVDMQGNAFIQQQSKDARPIYTTVSRPTQEDIV